MDCRYIGRHPTTSSGWPGHISPLPISTLLFFVAVVPEPDLEIPAQPPFRPRGFVSDPVILSRVIAEFSFLQLFIPEQRIRTRITCPSLEPFNPERRQCLQDTVARPRQKSSVFRRCRERQGEVLGVAPPATVQWYQGVRQ
jgi:hypothetical protein